MVELVNILTRTSGRPRFFQHNHEAVLGQSYPRVRHLVCYDDEETSEYVRAAIPAEDAVSVQRLVRQDSGHFPYNLYLNRLLQEVREGWVVFLDDDDLLMRGDAVAKMVETAQTTDEVLLWQVQFPRGRLVPRRIGKKPVVGDVTCCGFMFHISQLPRLERDDGPLWSDRKGGDFLVIQRCYELLRPRWLQDVLTGVNYLEPRNIGSGLRQDCQDRSILEPETENSAVCLKRRTKGAGEHIAMPRGKAVKKLPPPILKRIEPATTQGQKPLMLTIAPRRKEQMPIATPGSESNDAVDNSVGKKGEVEEQDTVDEQDEIEDETEDQDELEAQEILSEEGTDGRIDPEELIDDVQENTAPTCGDATKVIVEHFRGGAGEPVVNRSCSATKPIGPERTLHFTEEELDGLVDRLFLRWQRRSDNDRPMSVDISHGSGLILPTPVGKDIVKETPLRGGLPKATQVLDANRQVNRRLLEASRRGMRRGGEAALNGATPKKVEAITTAGRDDPSNAGITLDNYFGQIYIIDQHGAGNALQKNLGDMGIIAKVVKMGKGERADPKSTIFDFLPQVATEAQKKACPRVLVLIDQAMPHRALVEEFTLLGEALGGQEAIPWRVLYCGAAQNLVKSEQFDAGFYLEQYSDLVNANITDEQLATRHWRYYGQKEGRFGFRGWEAPQVIKDICAIGLDASLYEEIARCRKSSEVLKILTRYLEDDSLACSPLLFMSATGRKNRFNLQRYMETPPMTKAGTGIGTGRRENSRL